MEVKKTQRGYNIVNFTDSQRLECKLQKSSIADENRIWFGIKNPRLTIYQDEKKGKYMTVKMPDNWDVDSYMHLNQEQVKEILPALIKFANTGELE